MGTEIKDFLIEVGHQSGVALQSARRAFWGVPWMYLAGCVKQRLSHPVICTAAGLGLCIYPAAAQLRPVVYMSLSVPGAAVIAYNRKRLIALADQEEFDAELLQRQRTAILEATGMVYADQNHAEYLQRSLEAYGSLPQHLLPSHLRPQQQESPKQGKFGDMDWSKFLDEQGGSRGAIDVDATEIKSGGSTVKKQGAQPIVYSFEEVDLAGEAARLDRSLLLSAPSGVGKTNFIRWFLHAVNGEYEGNAIYRLVDFKGITGHYCGLEKTQNYVKSGASGMDYSEAQQIIQSTVELLDSYQSNGIPYYFVADEINNGLKQAAGSAKNGKQAEDWLKRSLSFIVTQGRERDIRGVLTSQSNLMDAIGLDTNEAQSLIFAVLGRKLEPKQGNGFALIRRILDSPQATLFSSEEKAVLKAKFEQIRSIAEETEQAIVLTNISGNWEFYFLPEHYAEDPGMLDLGFQNQSLEQQVESFPLSQPVEPSAAQKTDSSKPRPFNSSLLPEKGMDFLMRVTEMSEEFNRRVFKVRFLYKRWAEYNLKGTQFEIGLEGERVNGFRSFLTAVNVAGGGKFVFPSVADSADYWEITASPEKPA